MDKCKKNLKFIQGVDFELIKNLPNSGTKYLLIFYYSCEEISNSKQFVKVDLTPKIVDALRYFTNSGSVLSKIYLPAGTETKFLDDAHTIRLCTPNISNIFPKFSKTIHPPLSKNFHSIPQRMSSKLTTRRAKGSSKSRRSKISKRNIRTHTKKNFTA